MSLFDKIKQAVPALALTGMASFPMDSYAHNGCNYGGNADTKEKENITLYASGGLAGDGPSAVAGATYTTLISERLQFAIGGRLMSSFPGHRTIEFHEIQRGADGEVTLEEGMSTSKFQLGLDANLQYVIGGRDLNLRLGYGLSTFASFYNRQLTQGSFVVPDNAEIPHEEDLPRPRSLQTTKDSQMSYLLYGSGLVTLTSQNPSMRASLSLLVQHRYISTNLEHNPLVDEFARYRFLPGFQLQIPFEKGGDTGILFGANLEILVDREEPHEGQQADVGKSPPLENQLNPIHMAEARFGVYLPTGDGRLQAVFSAALVEQPHAHHQEDGEVEHREIGYMPLIGVNLVYALGLENQEEKHHILHEEDGHDHEDRHRGHHH